MKGTFKHSLLIVISLFAHQLNSSTAYPDISIDEIVTNLMKEGYLANESVDLAKRNSSNFARYTSSFKELCLSYKTPLIVAAVLGSAFGTYRYIQHRLKKAAQNKLIKQNEQEAIKIQRINFLKLLVAIDKIIADAKNNNAPYLLSEVKFNRLMEDLQAMSIVLKRESFYELIQKWSLELKSYLEKLQVRKTVKNQKKVDYKYADLSEAIHKMEKAYSF